MLGGAEEDQTGPLRSITSTLVLLTSLFLLNFLSRIVFSPLLPIIEKEMELSHAESGSLFLFISGGYFISILLSSFVHTVINHKNTIFLSTFCSGITVILIGSIESFFALRLGLFCLGLTAGLYLPSALATITSVVPQHYLGRGMAVHELAPNIGFVVAPFLCQFMLLFFSWRGTVVSLGLVLLFSSVMYYILPFGCRRKGERISFDLITSFFLLPEFLLLGALFSLAICSTLGLYAMLPLYFVNSHNMEIAEANSLLALSRISSVFMPLLGGWLGDRFGNKNVIITVLCLSGILTVALGATSGHLLTITAILQAMVAVCFFPSGFVLLSRIRTKNGSAGAVSLCIPLAFLMGGGCMPTLLGSIGDHYSFSMGVYFVGGLMLLAGLFACFFPSFFKKS